MPEKHKPHRHSVSAEPVEAQTGRVGFWRLAGVFGWIGLTSIGGGRTSYMYETVVEKRGWLTNSEFVTGLGLGQVLPGSNVANVSVYLGNKLRGLPGSAAALFGVLFPGALATLFLSMLYFTYGTGPSVDPALNGMGAAVVGFLCVTTGKMAKRAIKGLRPALVAITAFLAAGPLRLDVPLVILAVGGVSVGICLWSGGEVRVVKGGEL